MSLQTTGVEAAKFLMSKGLSRDAAIAVCAVLWFESKLNPGSQGVQATETPGALNPGGAYGIASWNGERQQHLADFAKTKNLPVDQLETQLWFVLNESANRYLKTWNALMSGGTYEQIIPVFVADYENPKEHGREIDGSFIFAHELAPLVPLRVPEVPAKVEASEVPAKVEAPAGPAKIEHDVEPKVRDSEFAALEAAYDVLKGLDPSARHRVLVYLYGRFQEKEMS
jgi:hypothetical protein